MPTTSRWGARAGQINLSCPRWLLDAIGEIRWVEHHETLSACALALVLEALEARGIHDPTEATGKKKAGPKARRTPKG